MTEQLHSDTVQAKTNDQAAEILSVAPVENPIPQEAEETNAPSTIEWEQVSRLQRVLGVITDILISDDIVQSIDFLVKENVQPVNNPVVYDYVDQTLKLYVNEKLTAAGAIQDKLKNGSAFLVSFAQFAIPPEGNIVIAARFSSNYFFYKDDEVYIDIKGQPYDLQAELAAANPESAALPTMESRIVYEMDTNDWNKPLSQIPYYRQGKSEPLPETVFQQFDEGHQPWLSNPVTVALVNCSNWIGSENVGVLQEQSTIEEKKIVIDSDRIITEKSGDQSDITVQMTKQGGVIYTITMYAPEGTQVLFVKQITEHSPST